MRLIKEDYLNIELDTHLGYIFEVPEQGIYLIEINAAAKNHWQNTKSLRSFFDDDDLAVQLDGQAFPQLKDGKSLFDGEAAWNGNKLKNLYKTLAIVVNLEVGQHLLEFLVDVHPWLKSIRVWEADGNIIEYSPENNPAENGDRRPWITLALQGVGLGSLNISANAGAGTKTDDENIKLIIDGVVEKNDEPKAHLDWYWCGKLLKGKSKILNKELGLGAGLHYIELWADRSPKIDQIILKLNKSSDGSSAEKDPKKIKEGFNPQYVLKDSAFENYGSMDEKAVQDFLDAEHKNKNKSHLAVMKFDGKSPAFWIKQAADKYSINPKLLLTKLQAESRLIRGAKSVAPSQEQLDWALGVGALSNGIKLAKYKGFTTQVASAAESFRNRYSEAESNNFILDNVDGKVIKVTNAATYALYAYTPHFDGPKLVYNVYVSLFGYDDLGGVTDKTSRMFFPVVRLIASFLLCITAAFFNFSAKAQVKQVPASYPLYSYVVSEDLGQGWRLDTKLKIFSFRQATMDDGLYCGYRFGKINNAEAKAELFHQNQLVDSINLSDPDLVWNFEPDNLFYYQPKDFDGDGKKTEIWVAKYGSCSLNFLQIFRPNIVTGKIEAIPFFDKSKKPYDDGAWPGVDIGGNILKASGGDLVLRYYDNVNTDGPSEGFFTNFYKYNQALKGFVLEKTTPSVQ